MGHKVTVVMPVYNHAQYVGAAIQSIYDQTYKPNALVIIDDGSKDNSWDVICKLFNEQPSQERILTCFKNISVILLRQQNSGPSKARNVGIQSLFLFADVFAFLDADDIYEPTKIEKSVSIFEKLPQVGLVYSDYTSFHENGEAIREYKEPFDPNRLLENNIISTNSIVTKEALTAVGGFTEQLRVGEDYDLWIRISEKFGCYHIPESLFRYRITNTCASKMVSSEEWNKAWHYIKVATQKRRQ